MLSMSPDLVAAPDRRQQLRATIDELVAEHWLALPPEHTAYERADTPPLPRWVHVVASAQRATRIGTARGTPWHPELEWAAELALTATQHRDLLRINAWLEEGRPRVTVPPRERSLELFGAGREDALHDVAHTELFGDGRLSWELLGCAPVPPPLVCSRVGPGTTLLVISGHETVASMRRALVDAPPTRIGLVAHGAGSYFASAVTFVRTVDRAVDRILYFGDLDADDLATPYRAAHNALVEGLPLVEPAAPLYDLLLRLGQPSPAVPSPLDRACRLATWLPPRLRSDVIDLLVGGMRIAQEWLGYETLVAEQFWTLLD